MPLNASGSDRSREFVLVLVSTLIEEMNFVGSGDGNSWIDGDVGDCDSGDSFMIVLEVFDFSFGEETHQSNYI